MFRKGDLGHVILKAAVEGIAPVIGGCVGNLGSPVGGLFVQNFVQNAINHFGNHIINRWLVYSAASNRAQWEAVLVDVAAMSQAEVNEVVSEAVESLAPHASPEDKALAISYVSAIPGTIRRSLVSDAATGALSLPRNLPIGSSQGLLQLLPISQPPYAAPCSLDDLRYELQELIGIGGFGAVYKATLTHEQNLARAIKFCLDSSMLRTLEQEKWLLDRLAKTDSDTLPKGIVRLYGYDLKYKHPFLVYEYVSGGDLHNLLAAEQVNGRSGLDPVVAVGLLKEVAEPLSFAHSLGLVHRDLKPANILVNGKFTKIADIVGSGALKLTDFGIGGIAATHAATTNQMGSPASPHLSIMDQASMFRGSGTPLYMCREQRDGDEPDPRHDIYSLGVIWYQLLVGNTAAGLDPDWEDELEHDFHAPKEHIAVIKRCVGRLNNRPANAKEFLEFLHGLDGGTHRPSAAAGASPATRPSTTARRTNPAPDRSQREVTETVLSYSHQPNADQVIVGSFSGTETVNRPEIERRPAKVTVNRKSDRLVEVNGHVIEYKLQFGGFLQGMYYDGNKIPVPGMHFRGFDVDFTVSEGREEVRYKVSLDYMARIIGIVRNGKQIFQQILKA